MCEFIADNNCKIVIYGHSVNGCAIATTLKHHSVNVVAFLDRNAHSFNASGAIPVFHPNTGAEWLGGHLDDVIVVISIANVFEHRSVAAQLHAYGFQNIILFPDFLFDQRASAVRKMKQVFHNILAGKGLHGDRLATFSALEKHLNTNVIKEDRDSVTALVPIELIHIGDKQTILDNTDDASAISRELEKLPYYFNTPLAGFNYYLNLYDFFSGKNENGIDSYFAWKQAMHRGKSGKSLTLEDKDRLIEDRRSVYINMADALAMNDQFFRSNPVDLRFNERGYFYLIDGANRTCFYLHKGLRLIPARVDSASYNAWADSSHLCERERQCLLEHKLLQQYPIHLHSLLYAAAPSPSFDQYEKYLSICRFLSAHAINLTNSKVLVVNSTNAYFSLFFARMGGEVTSQVSNDELEEYNVLVNKLCFAENIDIAVGSPGDMTRTTHYDIVVYLDGNDALWGSEEEDEFVRKMTASLFFWVYESRDAADRIKKNCEGYSHEELHRFCGHNKQYYNVYGFYKEPLSV